MTRVSDLGPQSGFTLIEMIIVIAIIGILAAIAVPALRDAPRRAKEAVLREDLFTMRNVLDQFFADKGRYPQALEELVAAGYIRVIPRDPITKSAATWQLIFQEVSTEEDGGELEDSGGIIDVRSGSPDTSLDGTLYSDW